MANAITITIDDKNIKRKIKKLKSSVIEEIVFAAALDATGDAIQAVPFDTGTLARSIGLDPGPVETIYKLTASQKYAPFVEFGTGDNSNLIIPEGLENFAAQFKGNRTITGQKAQPYLYPAAVKAQGVIRRDIITLVNELFN